MYNVEVTHFNTQWTQASKGWTLHNMQFVAETSNVAVVIVG